MNEVELRASEEIRNLLSQYHFYGDQGMAGEYSSLFAEDGVLETSGSGTFTGRTVIADYLAARHDARLTIDTQLNQSRHHLASVYVYEIDGNTARAHSYFQVLTPLGRDHWGSYKDQLIKVGDEWKFARRLVTIDGQSDSSWRSRVPPTTSEAEIKNAAN